MTRRLVKLILIILMVYVLVMLNVQSGIECLLLIWVGNIRRKGGVLLALDLSVTVFWRERWVLYNLTHLWLTLCCLVHNWCHRLLMCWRMGIRLSWLLRFFLGIFFLNDLWLELLP